MPKVELKDLNNAPEVQKKAGELFGEALKDKAYSMCLDVLCFLKDFRNEKIKGI